MKSKHIHTGHRYYVRISRKLVIIEVLNIRKNNSSTQTKSDFYDVTVIETRQRLTLVGVSKFRRVVELPRFDFELGKIVFSKKEM